MSRKFPQSPGFSGGPPSADRPAPAGREASGDPRVPLEPDSIHPASSPFLCTARTAFSACPSPPPPGGPPAQPRPPEAIANWGEKDPDCLAGRKSRRGPLKGPPARAQQLPPAGAPGDVWRLRQRRRGGRARAPPAPGAPGQCGHCGPGQRGTPDECTAGLLTREAAASWPRPARLLLLQGTREEPCGEGVQLGGHQLD